MHRIVGKTIPRLRPKLPQHHPPIPVGTRSSTQTQLPIELQIAVPNRPIPPKMPPPRILPRVLSSTRPTTSSLQTPLYPLLPTQQTRAESTTRRHKKLHYLPPAPSYTPKTAVPTPEIIYNPPSASPNLYHTPLKFLPAHDRRRTLLLKAQSLNSNIATTATALSSGSRHTGPTLTNAKGKDFLPPPIRQPYEKKYHLTPDQIREIQELRASDPDKWTRVRLAEKFGCSQFFVGLVAKSEGKAERVEEGHRRARERWGPIRRRARREREQRRELWGRDV